MDEERLLTLIERVYAAAMDARLWRPALAQLSESTGRSVIGLQVYDASRQLTTLDAGHGFSPEESAEYLAKYASLNPWYLRSGGRLQAGMVQRGEDVMANRELERTRFHADFLLPKDVFHSAIAVVAADRGMSSALTFLRARREGTFRPEELHLLTILLPHVQRAVRLNQRLRGLAATRDALLATLDREQTAAMLLDLGGRVQVSNDTAEALLSEADGLCTTRLGLEAADPTARRELTAAVGSACAEAALDPGGLVSVPRPGRHPLAVSVMPLPRPTFDDGRGCRVLVVARDPERTALPGPATLQAAHGLTPAEARVAVALVGGLAPTAIGAQLGISMNTVRTHLKHVYSKVGVRRQSELVRVLLNETGVAHAS